MQSHSFCTNLCLTCVMGAGVRWTPLQSRSTTEAAAETVAAIWLTEGLLQSKFNQKNEIFK